MRILFAGSPASAVATLDALVAAGHSVVGVITREDSFVGRKKILTQTPVADAAEAHGIEVFKSNRLDSAATEWVAGKQPQLGVVVAFGGLIREPLLSMPDLGWINLHFSTLPKWRGAAPVQRALMAGERVLGVSVFRLVAELDAGPVLTSAQQQFALGTTASEALEVLATFGSQLVLDAIQLLEHDVNAGSDQQGIATYARKLDREDGKLNPASSIADFLAHWSGVTREPGGYVTVEGRPLKILELRNMNSQIPLSLDEDFNLHTMSIRQGKAILRLADGELEVLRVQPFGKPAMSAADWLRGKGETVYFS